MVQMGRINFLEFLPPTSGLLSWNPEFSGIFLSYLEFAQFLLRFMQPALAHFERSIFKQDLKFPLWNEIKIFKIRLSNMWFLWTITVLSTTGLKGGYECYGWNEHWPLLCRTILSVTSMPKSVCHLKIVATPVYV